MNNKNYYFKFLNKTISEKIKSYFLTESFTKVDITCSHSLICRANERFSSSFFRKNFSLDISIINKLNLLD
jgi:hypothetical protein